MPLVEQAGVLVAAATWLLAQQLDARDRALPKPRRWATIWAISLAAVCAVGLNTSGSFGLVITPVIAIVGLGCAVALTRLLARARASILAP